VGQSDAIVDNEQPVTVVITQQVKPGLEQEFESWLHGVTNTVKSFTGSVGIEIIRPEDHAHPEYVTIFRFDNYDNLKTWQLSDERRRWLEKLSPFVAAEASQELVAGIEYWFTPAERAPTARPAPFRQAAVTWLAVYPLVTLLVFLLTPFTGGLPMFVHTLILTVILVLLLTYLVMPRMTKLFANWLFAR
jgi:antibiotic biosynthesis monooxygenase (ABM) superfamily enzyme